jgi:hypothetical protein
MLFAIGAIMKSPAYTIGKDNKQSQNKKKIFFIFNYLLLISCFYNPCYVGSVGKGKQ